MGLGRRYPNQRAETLDYLQSMLRQFRAMAAAEGCEMLVYFLEMAYVEANDLLREERAALLDEVSPPLEVAHQQ
ncbi:hypothetical protein [Nitratireductor luteus]|uniref:hypothetical protein n=1 Tax=Nitratireductor luteus TaxID=2976980 RepID=UPI0022401D37|nr:hypothetical protein [Nitratireductor luteus]